jgi:hypothetical protein
LLIGKAILQHATPCRAHHSDHFCSCAPTKPRAHVAHASMQTNRKVDPTKPARRRAGREVRCAPPARHVCEAGQSRHPDQAWPFPRRLPALSRSPRTPRFPVCETSSPTYLLHGNPPNRSIARGLESNWRFRATSAHRSYAIVCNFDLLNRGIGVRPRRFWCWMKANPSYRPAPNR